jgi:hypothetical protein
LYTQHPIFSTYRIQLTWHPVSQQGQVHVVLTAGGLKHALITHRGKMMMLHANLENKAMSVYLPVINTV